MKRFDRTSPPLWLDKKWEIWGMDWKNKYDKNRKANEFIWRKYKGFGYDDLIEKLGEMTQNHCSFCDAYPMFSRCKPAIEHFEPKTVNPLIAYKWDNLYISCYNCNSSKGDNFTDELLKPDTNDYQFSKYFVFNNFTGELEPNPYSSDLDKQRAEFTINLYGLNKNGKPNDRLEELEKINKANINKYSYRFLSYLKN